MRGKADNAHAAAKIRLRQRIVARLPDMARVLEGYAGTGRMYRACYSALAGACMDNDQRKVQAAALERPRWSCYQADTPTALERGWAAWYPWDLVDLDTWGEPWTAFRAWCRSDRRRAETTHVVLTDGYASRASVSTPCRALWPDLPRGLRLNVPRDAYRRVVEERVTGWVEAAGLTIAAWRVVPVRLNYLHHLTLAAR